MIHFDADGKRISNLHGPGLGLKDHAEVLERIAAERVRKEAEWVRERYSKYKPPGWSVPRLRDPIGIKLR